MSQGVRAAIGFLVAPAFPSALLYLYNFFWKGMGDTAVFLPYVLSVFAYAAALVLGIPAYLVLHRHRIRSLLAYAVLGTAIGPAFYLMFDVVTAYPGTLEARLRHAPEGALLAAGYAASASLAFWTITYWGGPDRSGAQP